MGELSSILVFTGRGGGAYCRTVPTFLRSYCFTFVTDRVRSTKEGYVLTRVCPSIRLSVHIGGGYPGQVQQEGVSHLGYPPPTSDLAGGTPPWVLPPPPFKPGRGVPLPPTSGNTKQMEYLIRRGRYASCVHAGGLSCISLR